MHSMNEYSSAIQLRSDRWSALREASAALTRDPKAKEIKALTAKVEVLFQSLCSDRTLLGLSGHGSI